MTGESENISDAILVERIRLDNKDAFKSLYDRYSRKIYFFSLKYLNTSDAEELVQTVFINVWEKRETLDPGSPVKSYIYKAAVNYIINFLRKKTIHAKFVESGYSVGEKGSDVTYEEVFFHDLERSLNSIVETLPAGQQKIFRLNRYEGLSPEEIAKELDLSVRTVENQVYRSIKMIRAILKEKYY